MIEVKSAHILNMLMAQSYSPLLIRVLLEVEKKYGKVCITSAYREGDPGVHGSKPFCRGIDIRSHHYENPAEVENWVNKHTRYDTARPEMNVALLHDSGRGNHIHLQTHPASKIKF